MTDKPTAADFAAVPWGGHAVPPEGSGYTDAVRMPWARDDTSPWTVRGERWSVNLYPDSQMAAEGWTLPAPVHPWDTLSPNLRDAWDTGEERDGEDEPFVFQDDDGVLYLGFAHGEMSAQPYRRFRPRSRPAWRDAEVVEASTGVGKERRNFWRAENPDPEFSESYYWIDGEGNTYGPLALVDPVPKVVRGADE